MSESKDDFDRIAPAEVALTRDEGVAPPTERAKQRLEPVLWISLVAALVIIVGIVALFPEFDAPVVEPESIEAAPSAKPGPSRSAGPSGETLSPFEQAQLQKERKSAQDILEELIELQYLLEDMSVELWGQEDLDHALAVAAEGDEIFLSQDYEGAANRYREARSRLDELVSRGERLLEDRLTSGFEALDDGDVSGAREAFEMAIAIDPNSNEARRGLDRTAKLNRVLALLTEAEDLEERQRFADALDRYRQVREIDPETKGIGEAIADAESAVREQRFSKAMTQGYAALADSAHSRARDAFERAQRISDNQEVRDALAEVDMRVTLATIARHKQHAEAAVGDERWDDAVKAFEAALAVDSTLLFAVDGLENARRRANLDKALKAIIEEPATLSADDAYKRAVELYRAGVAIEDGGERLTEQLDELERLLDLYQKPVAVTFRSDNETDVTVLKVARLGRFSRRELELRPGFYTVVGARNGYRDVRRQIEVLAGEPTPPITIECDEKI